MEFAEGTMNEIGKNRTLFKKSDDIVIDINGTVVNWACNMRGHLKIR